jgi:membrane-associated protein
MNFILSVIDFFLHLDLKLSLVIVDYGGWTYGILFLIIFLETGLVVTPILPGDSLLFAAGTFAALGSFKIFWLWLLLATAAILGDTANYWIGHFLGDKLIASNSRFINKAYLERGQQFYEKHGAKTIVLARFVPIVRTFAPFIAGVSRMNYGKFIVYNIFGGLAWVSLFVFGGYFFGNLPIVKNNFSLVVLAIIVLSVMPMVIDITRSRRQN